MAQPVWSWLLEGFGSLGRRLKNYLGKTDFRVWVHIIFRLTQMILGIYVIGLYAQDLRRAAAEQKYSDGKWVFATVVASISAITALVYMFVLQLSNKNMAIFLLFLWDFVIFVLWAAVFGIFGMMYIKAKDTYDGGIRRMKTAVWVDCALMILWFFSTASGTTLYFQDRVHLGIRLHGGRAKEV